MGAFTSAIGTKKKGLYLWGGGRLLETPLYAQDLALRLVNEQGGRPKGLR